MIVVADYGVGNVGAIENMIRRVGGEVRLASDPASLAPGDRLILPGVGAFDAGVEALTARGWWAPILSFAAAGGTLLGVCLGMQLLGLGSEEGTRPGLGLLRARAVRVRPAGALRTPHMGWNDVVVGRPTALFTKLEAGARFYFAHSFHLECQDPGDVVATVEYGGPLTACVQRGNVFGTQFHPEKSHRFGLQLLRNFALGA